MHVKTHDRGVVPLGGPHVSACMNVFLIVSMYTDYKF